MTALPNYTGTASNESRFWPKVRVVSDGGCWEWTAGKDRWGYGHFHVKGEGTRNAHRAAWEFTNGPIPEGLCVLHRCDNPACCNPAHLFLGTVGDNIADKVAKLRQPRGESHGGAKLTSEQVLEIRKNYTPHSRQCGGQAFARRFGISAATVDDIVNGRLWKHLLPLAPA